MNKSEFNALANDFFAAEMDNVSEEELDQVFAKYGLTVDDEDILDRVITETDRWRADYRSNLANINKANKDRLASSVVAGLVKDYDAAVGEDVRKDENGLFISPKLLDKIIADLPPGVFDEMKAKATLLVDRYNLLVEELGVPFFDLLEALAKRRIKDMDDAHTIHYLNIILDGITSRHPWLLPSQFPYRFMASVCGERLKRIDNGVPVSTTTADFDGASCLVMAIEDILTALGRPKRTNHLASGFSVQQSDILALEKVWLGKNILWGEVQSTQDALKRHECN
jgi:hypothetical protein